MDLQVILGDLLKIFQLLSNHYIILFKKNQSFVFGEDQLLTFEKLKLYLTSPQVLCLYSPLLETELHCDASQIGFGSVLVQKQKYDGKFHPVFYFSKRTTECETKYHSYELEC